MKWGVWIAFLIAGSCFAENLDQQYEKAYYLETAKGKAKEAAEIYQTIAENEPTAENKGVIKKSLLRLLHIGTKRKHEPTIRDCQEKLLAKTDLTIQALVDQAKEDATIYIPAGEFEGRIVLNKDITLKGVGEKSVIQATADEPLILIEKKVKATLEGLTLKTRKDTSDRTDPPNCAIYVQDAELIARGCFIVALDNIKRSPLGVYVKGFSNARLLDSHFEGYDYPIFFSEGTEGLVKNCVVKAPGSCGFMSHAESEVTIEGCVFTGSAKHGVRSTGGTLLVRDNLIIKNKNRGIYLGNKTTHGEISNNVIIENGSGISVFASSDVEIENNVILANGFSGIDTRSYGRVQIKNNIIANNAKTGFAVFDTDKSANKFKVGKNTFHGNGQPSTDFDLPSSTLEEPPQFADVENGDFTAKNSAVKSAKHGLTNPAAIIALWARFFELEKAKLEKRAAYTPAVSHDHARKIPFAWRAEAYAPPDFEGFFPNDEIGGELLDKLWDADDKDQRSDAEIFQTVQNGLRRTSERRSNIIRWIGNKYVWSETPQNPLAIEIMYHATDDPRCRHYAVYFGLSVVDRKTPSILRALTELSLKTDDPNTLRRVAWGAKSQKKALTGYLAPYLESDDPSIQRAAEARRKIFMGEIDAFAWRSQQLKEKAETEYAHLLPEIKQTLLSGSSAEREKALASVRGKSLGLIMDDSFLTAYAACATDADARVRNSAVKTIGGQWVWRAKPQHSDAIKLLLKASKDENSDVRYNSVYYGLSTVQDTNEAVLSRLTEMALDEKERRSYGRAVGRLKRDKEWVAKALEMIIAKDDEKRTAALKLYQDVVGKTYKGDS